MKKNIAIVITRLDLGGAQKVALYLAEKLDKKKFNVHLIAGRGGYMDRQIQSEKSGVTYQLWKEIKHPISPFDDAKAVFKLMRYFKDNKIDIVHTHSSKAGILGRKAAWLAGVKKIVHTIHGFSFHEYQNFLMRSIYRFLEISMALITDDLIAVGEDVVDYGIKMGVGKAGKYTVIRAGVELEKFKKTAALGKVFKKKYGIKTGQYVVGMIGNLKKQKNPLAFIEIAKRVIEKNPKVIFKFAGDGPLRQKAEELISRYELNNNVELSGWVEKPEEFMAACDLFILTSLWEGLPCTLAQAAAAGKICVASDVYGNREIIKGLGAGYLFKPSDYDSAAAYIIEEMSKKSGYKPRSAQYLSQFNADLMVKQHEKLYLS
ncbi:MAG: glycosyltransferase family 4 protein [Candidatus Goldbacteria bacterium]|nr:glycosyltransferase family 4 protein [Candidatus Goldiibacteriota bacterium]